MIRVKIFYIVMKCWPLNMKKSSLNFHGNVILSIYNNIKKPRIQRSSVNNVYSHTLYNIRRLIFDSICIGNYIINIRSEL